MPSLMQWGRWIVTADAANVKNFIMSLPHWSSHIAVCTLLASLPPHSNLSAALSLSIVFPHPPVILTLFSLFLPLLISLPLHTPSSLSPHLPPSLPSSPSLLPAVPYTALVGTRDLTMLTHTPD